MQPVFKLLAPALLAAPLLAGAGGHGDAAPLSAAAALAGLDGQPHGRVTLTETTAGVLLKAELTGLPAGVVAFHIHAEGRCEPPFQTAGGHFNPAGAKHGFHADEGPHAGDMPNLHVPESGQLTIEVLNTFVTLKAGAPNSLLDGNGTSLMIHAGADDYRSDPAGDAGARIACGVIRTGK